MSESVKRLSVQELREGGYLQEVNRRFFHPLGLALEITMREDGSGSVSGVQDWRDDPEGMIYGDPDATLAARVDAEWSAREPARVNALGWMVEPPLSTEAAS